MELSAKDQVMIAMYTEYMNDLPNFKKIKPAAMDMEKGVFHNAVIKLQNEELISGAYINLGSRPATNITDIWNAKPTSKGISYVESLLKIEPELSSADKRKKILENSSKWVLTQTKDVGSKLLAELIRKSLL
ncbi:hypothetical protein H1230_18860 [Paenibacillus sp. 19GGS1-52]|uniref:hypothetical protein n=1 Tax=Paenibacillus sp. 19GGS1-52 TaxID=2758563 RepID=UPI001EFA7660|nr:hypothetical protein [Paenibacillus sp. 19GGS1-52]ULO05171.1 hypothetical protein H1230_18860 [Paenibacillus sp. 19GGS1-52]